MVIRQGDIFWLELDEPQGSEPGYKHPHVVIQNDAFNISNINTAIVIALTSNLKRATTPGNVMLRKGEGNLPKKSVVNSSQILTVNKSDLIHKIGTLSANRIDEIIAGINTIIQRNIF
ncbi:MAG: PemK family transcriptional regulator [Spirochaetes bacterium RBG_16_49_21]|nr:MAG: PemK family transcriptional regulator [Spirochaetes bacterium RBG_16_49_21]